MQKRAGFHRLQLNDLVGLMRLGRLFGFKIEDLAADHAAESSRARQAKNEFRANPRIALGRRVRRDIERIGQKAIANKNCGGLAEGLVGRRPRLRSSLSRAGRSSWTSE